MLERQAIETELPIPLSFTSNGVLWEVGGVDHDYMQKHEKMEPYRMIWTAEPYDTDGKRLFAMKSESLIREMMSGGENRQHLSNGK